MEHEILVSGAAQVTVGKVTTRRVMGRGRRKREELHLQIVISDAEGNEITTINVRSTITEMPVLDLIVDPETAPEQA